MFRVLSEPASVQCGEDERREHLIDIRGYVLGGKLQVEWEYSERVHRAETIKRVGGWFMEALRELIEQCAKGEAVGFTPSDFPLAGLEQYELDTAFDELEFEGL
jgi:non-ribosomal peptide synthase protein (TIGR01720 family)